MVLNFFLSQTNHHCSVYNKLSNEIITKMKNQKTLKTDDEINIKKETFYCI